MEVTKIRTEEVTTAANGSGGGSLNSFVCHYVFSSRMDRMNNDNDVTF